MTKKLRDRWITAAWAVIWVATIVIWQLGYTDTWPPLIVAFAAWLWRWSASRDRRPKPPVGPPPGWYTDPEDPAMLRHWDGRKWETLTQPHPPAWAGIARLATRREILHALSWAVPTSIRSGALPVLVGGTALWSACALWLLDLGPFWLLLIYTFAATIAVTLGWAVLTARHLSDPRRQVLISSRSDALLGLMLVRDPAMPYLKVHAHYATPVGAGSGRRFRAALTPYVKEFVTDLEPGMPIQFTCPRQLWQKLEQEIGQAFPAAEGWRVTRTKAMTSIQPPSVLDGPA